MNKGTVKFFNEVKGFGFIIKDSDNTEIFFHISGLADAVQKDDKVTFEIGEGRKGPLAENIKKA